jgi:hypothetical protein
MVPDSDRSTTKRHLSENCVPTITVTIRHYLIVHAYEGTLELYKKFSSDHHRFVVLCRCGICGNLRLSETPEIRYKVIGISPRLLSSAGECACDSDDDQCQRLRN